VPQFKGQFILPQMQWTYFDVKKGDYETITLEETTLTVNGIGLKEAATDDNGTIPKVQREVSNIDSDIRYLQEVDEKTRRGEQPLLWVWAVLGLVLLGWLLQLVSLNTRTKSPEAERAAVKNAINTAWKTNEPDAVGKMLNALEVELVRKGIAKENISLFTLNEVLGAVLGTQLNTLIEKLQLALYAPSAKGSNEEWLNEFNALWEQL
jgi:hypothetical protein